MRGIRSYTNQTRIGEISLSNNTTDLGNCTSEDDDSSSDHDFPDTETESDDTSAAEHISNEDVSTESTRDDEDDAEDTHFNAQPQSTEKGGIIWTTKTTTARGRFQAN